MKILTTFVERFQKLNQKSPTHIVVAPAAALILAKRQDLPTHYNGIPVQMRLWEESEAVKPGTGTRLALFLKEEPTLSIQACELK